MTMQTTPDASWTAYLELKKQVTALGLDKPTPGLALTIYAFHMSCMFVGLAPLVFGGWSVWAVLGLLVSTYGSLGISTSGHVASHNTLTYNRKWDRFFTYFGFTFLLGVSEHFWRNKHVRTHHAHPNHVGMDDDIDLRPFFSVTRSEIDAATGFKAWWFSVQHWFIVPALAFNAINVQRTGWLFLAAALWNNPKQKHVWIDFACIVGHFTLWIGLPLIWFPAADVFGVYLIRKVLMGFAMFSAFAPAHFPVAAEAIAGPPAETDHVTRQLYTTVNFTTGFFGRIVCSGVDYQIEHHLLPTANQYQFHKLQPLVQQFCKANGYPYYSTSWANGIWQSIVAFKVPKRVVPVQQIARGGVPSQQEQQQVVLGGNPDLEPSF